MTLVSAISAVNVQAQETTDPGTRARATLEEVVVTAQRREENLQDVPISVVAISDDFLNQGGVDGTASLPQMVPSVQLVRSGPSGMFFVRGVGNTSGGTGEEGANAMYVDGVFLPDLKQSILKFNNIERIEVLKGPQGTLFGRNSSGGLINVITREPGDELVVKAKAGISNYQTQTAQLYVAGPVSENLSADIALTSTNQSEGWGENQATGKDVGKGWDWGVRSKWVWTPNDATKISASAEYTKQSDDYTSAFRLAPDSVGLDPVSGSFLPPSDPYDTNTPDQQFNDQRNIGFNLTAEIDLGWSTLTSITAYRDNKNLSSLDPDTGPSALYHINIDSSTQSLQEEIRLSSNTTDPLSWQTGIFLLRAESELSPQQSEGILLSAVGGGNDVNSTMTTWSSSAFGEISYALTDATTLTAGIRYTLDKQTLDGEQSFFNPAIPAISVRETEDDEETTYRLALRHDITDQVNVYASYNRGYKSGVFSMSSITQPRVLPQTIDAYELGMKSQLWDDRLRLNLAAFHYDISDYQVRAATNVGANAVLLNAAEVEVDGLEVEFEVIPFENLRVFGSATFLNSEFSEFPLAPYAIPNPASIGGSSTVIQSAKGNDTPLAPELAASLGVNYSVPIGNGSLEMNLLYSYNDGYFYESDNRLEQPAFDTVNGSILYQANQNWSVELWGRNLMDETYHVQKLGSALADVAVPAAPRTYGISLHYDY
ncbi:TonB-dependent receptor [Pseudomaricurvus sp.]|uniref:TonB-dependent receptor n=1 Tax=Pseudomaricurvus sp. TaxID=2004510 RepID=UPI003F6BA4E5